MAMAKPFEVAALVAKAKEQGLPLAEDVAEKLALIVFEWTEESIAIHPNPYVKFALPVVAQVKPLIMEQLDKLDGKVGV